MVQTLNEKKRRNPELFTSKVREVLPEFYVTDYPDLVEFLEVYYQFMDSDRTHGFVEDLHDLFKARDVEDNTFTQLDEILKEIGANIASTEYFENPRAAARLLAYFYRRKGSKFATELFFKLFFNTSVTIEYPKRNIFTVGESLIGQEGLDVIQDGRLYQTFSILVKSDLPIAEWGDLYTQLVHPAGFYVGSEVQIIGVAITAADRLGWEYMPLAIADSGTSVVVFSTNTGTSALITAEDLTTGVFDSGGPNELNVAYDNPISPYNSMTILQVSDQYQTIGDWITSDAFTLDQDSDGAGRTMDLSSTIETIDQQ